jgi:hypothetical protein
MNSRDMTQQLATANLTMAKDRGWLRPESSREIDVRDWPAFCKWFIAGYRGIIASLERHEKGSGPLVDCVERPLLDLRLRRLENGVTAITVTSEGKPRNTQLDLTGPRRMTIQTNAAGWPSRLTVAYEDGEFVAHFTGGLDPAAVSTGNSWGE